MFFGFILAGIVGLVPPMQQFQIPMFLRVMMFAIGILVGFVGMFLPHARALKTGAVHLIEPGRPGLINWFVVYPDGDIKVTPSVREVEGQLYSSELDAQIQELKSYRIFDHSIRFVLEGSGHAMDLGMCVYTEFLQNKWGFENLRQAREGGFHIFGFPKNAKKISNEGVLIPTKDGQYGKIEKEKRRD